MAQAPSGWTQEAQLKQIIADEIERKAKLLAKDVANEEIDKRLRRLGLNIDEDDGYKSFRLNQEWLEDEKRRKNDLAQSWSRFVWMAVSPIVSCIATWFVTTFVINHGGVPPK